jgi:hypothetical protein
VVWKAAAVITSVNLKHQVSGLHAVRVPPKRFQEDQRMRANKAVRAHNSREQHGYGEHE